MDMKFLSIFFLVMCICLSGANDFCVSTVKLQSGICCTSNCPQEAFKEYLEKFTGVVKVMEHQEPLARKASIEVAFKIKMLVTLKINEASRIINLQANFNKTITHPILLVARSIVQHLLSLINVQTPPISQIICFIVNLVTKLTKVGIELFNKIKSGRIRGIILSLIETSIQLISSIVKSLNLKVTTQTIT